MDDYVYISSVSYLSWSGGFLKYKVYCYLSAVYHLSFCYCSAV